MATSRKKPLSSEDVLKQLKKIKKPLSGEEALKQLKETTTNIRKNIKGPYRDSFSNILTNLELLISEIEIPNAFTIQRLSKDLNRYLIALNKDYNLNTRPYLAEEMIYLHKIIIANLKKIKNPAQATAEVKPAPAQIITNQSLTAIIRFNLLPEYKIENPETVSNMEMLTLLQVIQTTFTKEKILAIFKKDFKQIQELGLLQRQRKLAPIALDLREPKATDTILLIKRNQIVTAISLALINQELTLENLGNIREKLTQNIDIVLAHRSEEDALEEQKKMQDIVSMISHAVGSGIIKSTHLIMTADNIRNTLKTLKAKVSSITSDSIKRTQKTCPASPQAKYLSANPKALPGIFCGSKQFTAEDLSLCESHSEKIALAFQVTLENINLDTVSFNIIHNRMKRNLNIVFDAQAQTLEQQTYQWLNSQLKLAKEILLVAPRIEYKENAAPTPLQILTLLHAVKVSAQHIVANSPYIDATLEATPVVTGDYRLKLAVLFHIALKDLALNKPQELMLAKRNLERGFQALCPASPRSSTLKVPKR